MRYLRGAARVPTLVFGGEEEGERPPPALRLPPARLPARDHLVRLLEEEGEVLGCGAGLFGEHRFHGCLS